jgi:hypothetical protein
MRTLSAPLSNAFITIGITPFPSSRCASFSASVNCGPAGRSKPKRYSSGGGGFDSKITRWCGER